MAVTSGLYVALNNALSGLNVNKQALATISQNIANANTPGYARQKLTLANNVINGQGFGVKVEDISRQVDLYLQRAVQQQNSVISNASIANSYAERIQTLLGTPNGSATATGDTSIASGITGFFTKIQQLSNSPSDASLKVGAVQAGQSVAQQISNLAKSLQDLRYEADQQITQDVNTVNSLLKQLQSINSSLSFSVSSGNPSPDMLDQRDNAIKSLSQYVDINYYFDSQQAVHISTNGGLPLLDNAFFQLSYLPQSSVEGFSSGTQAMNPVNIYRVNEAGQQVPPALPLITGGVASSVSTSMVNGEMKALQQLRDIQLPQMIDQLDQLASAIADKVNAIHNSGSSYPGSNSVTGQRLVSAGQNSGWSGSVRIAVLGPNGQPLASPYANDPNGMPPLTLDLSNLNGGSGDGYPTVQSIINAINTYYAPQPKASLGDLHNIQLVSQSPTLPGAGTQLDFDFNLENLSGNTSQFFVTGVNVTDDTGAPMTPVTSSQFTQDLSGTNTYHTTAGSPDVTVTLGTAIPNLKEGDYIYLTPPTAFGPVDNIPADQLGGFFQVKNISGNTFQITAQTTAQTTANWNVAGMTATPKYQTVEAGQSTRTKGNGSFSVDLNSNDTSDFYTVSVDVATQNADGTLSLGTVQYKILNPAANTLNAPYGAMSGTGAVQVQAPQNYTPLVTAQLVDENGNPYATTNGIYNDSIGYLKISATNGSNLIAIDSLDSKEVGFPNLATPVAGTNRGFSYYFGLNNFFNEYKPTATGDTVAGSAEALSVNSALVKNPNLITVGQLTRSPNGADGSPRYTYERTTGDNSVAANLAALNNTGILFNSAGGLGNMTTTLNGYAGQILSFASAQASNAQARYTSENSIMQGLEQQVSSNSGVNLDEELANTIIYQNAYSASARIINVTNSLFDTLISSFQ